MENPEIFSALVATRAAQGDALGLLVTLNFAMYGATYYFLNRARIELKLLAFLLYTLGFIVFTGLVHLHSETLVGLRQDVIAQFPDSYAAKAWDQQQDATATMIIDYALASASIMLWLGAVYLLFVCRIERKPLGQ